jgi:hypothetical protein
MLITMVVLLGAGIGLMAYLADRQRRKHNRAIGIAVATAKKLYQDREHLRKIVEAYDAAKAVKSQDKPISSLVDLFQSMFGRSVPTTV